MGDAAGDVCLPPFCCLAPATAGKWPPRGRGGSGGGGDGEGEQGELSRESDMVVEDRWKEEDCESMCAGSVAVLEPNVAVAAAADAAGASIAGVAVGVGVARSNICDCDLLFVCFVWWCFVFSPYVEDGVESNRSQLSLRLLVSDLPPTTGLPVGALVLVVGLVAPGRS